MTSSGERTTADDLTAEQIERIIANHESGAQLCSVQVYRQLLGCMEREEKLKRAMVEAVIPLEALVLSGGDAFHGPELRQGIRYGIAHVRAALADTSELTTTQDGQREEA